MLDPKALRGRFSRVLRRNEIYLANHSLGRPLDQTAVDVEEALNLWYSDMDESWEAWLGEMTRWRGKIAQLIGLSRSDAVVPKTSAGQGLRSVLNAFPQGRPIRVVATRGEFDSIDFILKVYVDRGRASVDWVPPSRKEASVPLFDVDRLTRRLQGPPGLVVVSTVFFGTGQILDSVGRLVAEAHRRDWLVLLDLYHAAGVIPLGFEALGADFGIGGSYKYLRGGPGASWLAIHPRHIDQSEFRSLDTGWFAKRDTFDYERSETPEWALGGDGWLESTPPILTPYQARAGLDLVLEVGVENLREQSLQIQQKMRESFRRAGCPLFEPVDPTQYGAFGLLPHSKAPSLSAELKRRGVNTDSRGGFVRFGPDLLTTDEELDRAARIVAEALR